MAKRVFISSTSKDLGKYRQAAAQICRNLGFEPIVMEEFTAMGAGATEGSKRRLREADLYVGIVAHRYGYIEDGHDQSVTEIEFDYAGERGLERLCFLVDPAFKWPKTHIEAKQAARIQAFKDKIEKSVIRAHFSTVADFSEKLTAALVEWQEWRAARSGEMDAIYATSPDDIPRQPDRLVGREATLEEIQGLLDKNKRVLLQGFGGLGKSSIAACAAAERLTAGKGPVLWLRTGTEDFDGLLIALVRPFNAQHTLQKESGAANQAKVVRLLLAEHKVRLLVLDDVWNARALMQLLNANVVPAGLPILVTSRSRFPGLTRVSIDRLSRTAALDLLGHVSDRDFQADPQADTLCGQLGDHPFSIRLAGLTLALDNLTPGELLTRIAEAPWKLAAPEWAGEVGHLSVSDLINSSLYGLDAEARRVFLAFGAFFTANLTPPLLALYLGEDVAPVEDALNRLQRRGLAERVPETSERAVEYRVQEPAYHYSRAQTTPEQQGQALDAVLAYLGAHREPTGEHFAALRSEVDNFTGAVAWAMKAKRYADVQQLANWLYRDLETGTEGFLHLQGAAGVAVTFLEQAALASEALGQAGAQAAYLGHLGSTYRDLGQVKTGMKHYRAALKLYRDLGDTRGEGITLGRLGIAHRLLGQPTQAVEHLEQALSIARTVGNPRVEGINLGNLGIAYRQMGRVQEGAALLEEALSISLARGDKRGEAINRGNLGDAYRDLGRAAEAVAAYERALALAKETGDKRGEGINLGRLGDLYRGLSLHEKATEYLRRALSIARETGDKRGEAINLGRLGDVFREQGLAEAATQHHELAHQLALKMDDRRGEAFALADLGEDALAQGETAAAAGMLDKAREIFESLGLKHLADGLAARLEELKVKS